MNKRLILGLLFAAFAYGCPKDHGHEEFEEIKIEQISNDFKIPKKIFDDIEALDKNGAKKADSIYFYSPIKVILESDQIIKKSPLKFQFPNGGGKIDLKDYLTGEGTFSFSFDTSSMEEGVELNAIYFVSDTPVKKIDGENYGLGCGKIAQLTSQTEKLLKRSMIKLNTVDLKYLYVAAGYYIFVFKKNNLVWLTHLFLTDSRYNQLYCSSLYQ